VEARQTPGNILLEKAVSGLGKTSVINLSQITALDKSDLTEYVSMLPRNILSRINANLKLVLDLYD
jgi:mRNA interferase MazF